MRWRIILLGFLLLGAFSRVDAAPSGALVAERLSPDDSVVSACSELPVRFQVYFSDSTQKILWIDVPILSTGVYGYSTLKYTLSGRGFSSDYTTVSSDTITDSLCGEYDIIVLGFNLPRDLTAAERTALEGFVSDGGGLFVITEYGTDRTEYNAILSAYGISLIGAIDFAFTLSLSSHPVTAGVSDITGNGVTEISTSSPASCIGDYSYLFTTYCGLAVRNYGSGRVVCYFDELAFINGPYPYPLILEGIDDPDHLQFARNLFDWLGRRELYGVDTLSFRVSVNGDTIDITDPRLTYIDSVLTFTPSPAWDEVETVTVCLDSASSGLGHTLDSSICVFFYEDYSSPHIEAVVPAPGSAVDDSTIPIVAMVYDDFCDSLEISIAINGRYFTPESLGCSYASDYLTVDPDEFGGSWGTGEINVCIHSVDICPDTCGPNISDSCYSFTIRQPVVIDSVWVDVETDCNDSNIVTICYALSGDTADIVYIEASDDAGASWGIIPSTLIAPAGHIGANILPGIHCFGWLVSDDLPGIESASFMLKVIAVGEDSASSDSFPVDTRAPDISFFCPDTVSGGEMVHLEWGITDMFLGDAPCSLYICGEGYEVGDTFFNWTALYENRLCTLIVVVRDSFCNIARDTCTFQIRYCTEFITRLDCPASSNEFSSCVSQEVRFFFRDTTGASIDTMRVYFTVHVINRETGADSSFSIVPVSPYLHFVGDTLGIVSFPGADGDSVVVTLDSLFNESGCRTVP